MININESIIPLDFNWRSNNIQKNCQNLQRGGYYPIYFSNEYFESLWYELHAEILDQLRKYIGDMMNSVTYNAILHTINLAIIDFGGRYKELYSKDFIIELDRIHEPLVNKFYFDLNYLNNIDPKDIFNDTLYIDIDNSQIFINPEYIIKKIKEYSEI